jgi:putative heme-binding domain-containing protein
MTLTWSVEEEFELKSRIPKDSPQLSTMEPAEGVSRAVGLQGDVELGRYLFTKANCTACHTVTQSEPQKGPYLGNIAQTYKRPALATAIVQPSNTIAQGFATNSILTLDGDLLTGFVTDERSDRVTLRDQKGKETTIEKEEIELRKTSKISVMPTGVMNDYTVFELASLLDYLQSLVK